MAEVFQRRRPPAWEAHDDELVSAALPDTFRISIDWLSSLREGSDMDSPEAART
jgi:hypothetical protein